MTDPYRIRSAETWAQAREDYLAGLSAEAVCSRYDLGLSAFRRRARRHGWRRMDQDDPAPADLDLAIYDDIDMDDQVETARLRFVQALHHGKSVEAARWRRLWHQLREENDIATAQLDADLFPGMNRAEVAALLAADRAREDSAEDALLLAACPVHPILPSPNPAPENVHDVHPVFSGVRSPEGSPAARRGEVQNRNASTVPVARPPDTTAPPAMA